MPQTTIQLPDSRDLIRSLGSDLCPMCGATKRFKQTMCPRCYRALPQRLKQALYNRIGDGYEDAVRESMVVLHKETFILPPKESRGDHLFS